MNEITIIEPVRGWRFWALKELRPKGGATGKQDPLLVLGSIASADLWPPRKAAKAVCADRGCRHEFDENKSEGIPAEKGRCGLHGYKDLNTAKEDRNDFAGAVLGRLAHWGEVWDCKRGFRSQLGYPVSFESGVCWACRKLVPADQTQLFHMEWPNILWTFIAHPRLLQYFGLFRAFILSLLILAPLFPFRALMFFTGQVSGIFGRQSSSGWVVVCSSHRIGKHKGWEKMLARRYGILEHSEDGISGENEDIVGAEFSLKLGEPKGLKESFAQGCPELWGILWIAGMLALALGMPIIMGVGLASASLITVLFIGLSLTTLFGHIMLVVKWNGDLWAFGLQEWEIDASVLLWSYLAPFALIWLLMA